jgi:hypothetical protein
MAKRGEWVPVKRGDHERVLITDTLPFETPIIFSGDGFYCRLKKKSTSGRIHADLVDMLVLRKGQKPAPVTIPFSYKIRHRATGFRKLGVLHPSALWEVKEFYGKFDEWMIFECSRSPFSIRAPFKVSGSYYERSGSDAANQFKMGQVSTSDIDSLSRYNPSYFSYRGFTRLYRFFSSDDFVDLEKRYGFLRTLDVSRCFDSIYTHSISWALLGKKLAKENKKNAESNDKAFDDLMMYVNHGETNGIVIGPEISRIFAEIIFQTVDIAAARRLESRDFRHGREYSIRRYVDDVFIFADSDAVAEQVRDVYMDALAEFNLYSNPLKMTAIPRPFTTSKTIVIDKARLLLESLSAQMFENYDKDRSQLRPARIWRSARITADFLTAIKSICHEAGVDYHELSSYLISALCDRAKRLVSSRRVTDEQEEKRYGTVISILLRVLFFVYTVAPTVNASYRMALGIVLLMRFARRRLPHECPAIEQLVFSEALSCLRAQAQHKSEAFSGFVALESINLLLVIRELGDTYLVPAHLAEKLFGFETAPERCAEWCYFDIVSCMFYIQGHAEYSALRKALNDEIDRRLSDLTDLEKNAEKAYLFLDMLTCPFVTDVRKRLWIDRFCSQFSLPAYTVSEVQEFFAASQQSDWFINWEGVDILTMLQKKEFVRVY